MKKSILLVAAALWAGSAFADEPVGNEIVFGPAVTEVNATPGGTFDVPFNLTNTVQCVAFEWWIEANANISVEFIPDEGYAVDFGNRLTNNYSITARPNAENGNFWVLAKNESGMKLMPTGEGLFCTMTFEVRGDAPEGTYELKMYDAVFNWKVTNAEGAAEVLHIDPAAATIKVNVKKSGIDSIVTDAEQGDGLYYDLMGRRVDNPTPGFYIHNGEKVLVK